MPVYLKQLKQIKDLLVLLIFLNPVLTTGNFGKIVQNSFSTYVARNQGMHFPCRSKKLLILDQLSISENLQFLLLNSQKKPLAIPSLYTWDLQHNSNGVLQNAESFLKASFCSVLPQISEEIILVRKNPERRKQRGTK